MDRFHCLHCTAPPALGKVEAEHHRTAAITENSPVHTCVQTYQISALVSTVRTVLDLIFLMFQHLEESCRNGLISRHENKGKISYKDPESAPRGKSSGLKLSPSLDLTKVFVKALRELGEAEGSSLRAVEKFILSAYEIEIEQVWTAYLHCTSLG